MLFVNEDIWETIKLVSFWQKGLPPVAGGVLNQSKSFYDAAAFIMGEEQFWKSKLGILT